MIYASVYVLVVCHILHAQIQLNLVLSIKNKKIKNLYKLIVSMHKCGYHSLTANKTDNDQHNIHSNLFARIPHSI